jgi:hypothetical protein
MNDLDCKYHWGNFGTLSASEKKKLVINYLLTYMSLLKPKLSVIKRLYHVKSYGFRFNIFKRRGHNLQA